jgi:putative DNA primase/helicase
MIQLCPDFIGLASSLGEDETENRTETRLNLICAADITPQAIRWIWPGWLAAGKLHILAGAPGTGKSTIAFALAAGITTAGRWPDGTRAELGEVVIWSGEDDPQDTIVPRLMACGANLSRVHIVGGMEGGDPRSFDPAVDIGALRLALSGKNIRLLIVDPIVSAVSGDSHKNTEVRRALQPLVDMAGATGCAVLGISHFSKGTAGRDPIDRVTGSLAFGALARVVMAAAKLPEDEHKGARLLARAKSNIGPDSGGVLYHMDQVEIPGHPGIVNTKVLWGAVIEGSARDLLAKAEQNDGEDKSATDEAREWLAELLTQGPKAAAEVKKEARQAGISEKAVRLARGKLGVKPHKRTFAGGWIWELPQDALLRRCPEDARTQNEGILGTLG